VHSQLSSEFQSTRFRLPRHSRSPCGPLRYRSICSCLPGSVLQQKNDTFNQQTNLMIEKRRLKLAEEISLLPTFFSGNFC
jgi:hypothetical protein